MGFGDYLLVTALANNINKQKKSRVRYTRKTHIVGDDSQLGQGIMIKNNPKFYQIENLYQSGPISHISREKHHYNLDSDEHQIIQMCKKAGIKDNIILKPELYLTDDEYKNVNQKLSKIEKPFIVIEPFSKKINDEFFKILQIDTVRAAAGAKVVSLKPAKDTKSSYRVLLVVAEIFHGGVTPLSVGCG